MHDFQIKNLTVDDIKVIEGRNPRLTLANIEQLAESIEENGVRNPIKVQYNGKGYELVDGHRRLAACQFLYDTKELKMPIPSVIVDHYKNESDVLVEMMVSNDSEPFAPFEEATLYARLRDEFKLKNDEIALRVGKSLSHVSDKLALLRADESVKKAITEKRITASDANTIVRKSRGDKKKQKETVERLEKEGRQQVIDKELKKGRMAKPLWEQAETAYDITWTAMLDVGKDNTMPILDAPNSQAWFEDQVEDEEVKAYIQFAYGMGMLSCFANISGLTIKELWDRLEERLSGNKK